MFWYSSVCHDWLLYCSSLLKVNEKTGLLVTFWFSSLFFNPVGELTSHSLLTFILLSFQPICIHGDLGGTHFWWWDLFIVPSVKAFSLFFPFPRMILLLIHAFCDINAFKMPVNVINHSMYSLWLHSFMLPQHTKNVSADEHFPTYKFHKPMLLPHYVLIDDFGFVVINQ